MGDGRWQTKVNGQVAVGTVAIGTGNRFGSADQGNRRAGHKAAHTQRVANHTVVTFIEVAVAGVNSSAVHITYGFL